MAAPQDAIGIDLGTTYCAVSVIKSGVTQIQMVPMPSGLYTVSSGVIVDFSKGRIFDQAAKKKAAKEPDHYLYDSKRMIGLPYAHRKVQTLIARRPFKVVEKDGKPAYSVPKPEGGEDPIYPEQVSSMLLSYLKECTEKYLGHPIQDVVITCPAYFTEAQRQATMDAAELANLRVISMINEPTSAALAYGHTADMAGVRNVMVFDYGGTLDISVLEIHDNTFEVKAVAGDNYCGGQDLDTALAHELLERFSLQLDPPEDLSHNAKVFARVLKEATHAKITLSSSQEAPVYIEYLYQQETLDTIVTVDEFNIICEPIFQHCMECAQEALANAGLTAQQLDSILLVGGSSRIPRVQQLIKETFGKEPAHEVNPDEAVARGAAIQAAKLKGVPWGHNRIVVVPIIPYDFGVQVNGVLMSKLLEKGSCYNKPCSKDYSNTQDNQSEAVINVFEGHSIFTSENAKLGTLSVPLTPGPPNTSRIRITFTYDPNGVLRIEARDTQTNKIVTHSLTRKSNLSEAQKQHIRRQSERLDETDRTAKVRSDAYSSLSTACRALRNRLNSPRLQTWPERQSTLASVETIYTWIGAHSLSTQTKVEEYIQKKSEIEALSAQLPSY